VNHKRLLGTLPPEPVLLKTTIAGSSTRVFAEAGASFAIRGAFWAAMARVTVGSQLSWFRASAPLLYHLYWSSPGLFIQSHRPIRKYTATATRRAVRTSSIASKGNGTRGDYDKLLLLSGEYQPSPLLSAHCEQTFSDHPWLDTRYTYSRCCGRRKSACIYRAGPYSPSCPELRSSRKPVFLPYL
jgi:hypothetical protein